MLGGVMVLLGFHGYCLIPTFKLNFEWNSTHKHNRASPCFLSTGSICWPKKTDGAAHFEPQSSRNRWAFGRAGAE